MKNNNNILIWAITILVILNLTIVGTILVKSTNCSVNSTNKQAVEPNEPTIHLGKYFKDELNLSYEQHNKFREIRHKYHKDTDEIKKRMQKIRNQLLVELGKQNSNKEYLNQLANEIGKQHTALKLLTSKYYLDMKAICNNKQKEKLYAIFREVLDKNDNVLMPEKKNNY